MLLLYSETDGADEARALFPGRTRAKGSAWGRSLLALAWERRFGGEMPEIAAPERGKPCFPGRPEAHFSISHTAGLVLCALGTAPVGVDAERPRALYPGLEKRILSPEEAAQFDFFEVWTLRESYFKLTGQGGPTSPRFRREGGLVLCEDERVCCTPLLLAGCRAALCTWAPEGVFCERIPVEALMRTE